ncbi:hypothetical protein H0I23_10815 [Cellulophaga sp. HaHaR_3_176]|uniref:DUF5723 family protein n=1 Tax=Cellulophaga sp. HaHaR_3_176 TaxID=1942464 RepID=UPI001C1FA809|nr:DUF5723 family protein [Cellulophaga sp. HaHaR_3_176]QWX82952.1 hypothetical protein H0I23_10815 [Cellulophaga sp. HaHaR_3_176]
MRIFYILIVSLFLFNTALSAQNKQLLYDFEEVPQSLLLNPGMTTSYKWHSSVPLLGGFSFQVGNTGATPTDLFLDDGVLYDTKFREKVVYGMDNKDELSGNIQVEILNGGFRGKNSDNYYSFGIYTEIEGIGYYPQDIVTLAYEGNANLINEKFDFNDIKLRGEAVNVFHFGVNKKVSRDLTLGVRAKLYSSLFNVTSTSNRGYFTTTEGDNNLIRNTIVADIELQTSGVYDLKDIIEDDNISNGPAISEILSKRAFLGGNLGVGFDLGFTYHLNEQTKITGSLLDIGFIYHNKDVRTYSLKGSASVEGLEYILPRDLGVVGQDQWQSLVDDIRDMVPYEVTSENYLTFRPTKLNASIRHDFGDEIDSRQDCNCSTRPGGSKITKAYKNSVGGHLYAINRPRGPQTALTAFYQHRFGNVMSVKTTYTVDKFSYTNIGLGASIQAGPVNMYIMADNLIGYANITDSHYSSLQFGLNIISWGKK